MQSSEQLIDCVTFCPIPAGQNIRTVSGDFHASTLYKYYRDNKLDVPCDPFNRQPLSTEYQSVVLEYGREHVLRVDLYYEATSGTKQATFSVEGDILLGSLVCHVISEIEYDAPYYRYTDVITGEILMQTDSGLVSVYTMDFEAPVADVDACSRKIVLRLADKGGIPLAEVASKLCSYSKERLTESTPNYSSIYSFCRGIQWASLMREGAAPIIVSFDLTTGQLEDAWLLPS